MINKLNFGFNERELFKNLNLEIKKGTFTTIIGTNGSGKSTLIRLILGLLVGEGEIEVNGLLLNRKNLKEIIKKTGVVFGNPDDQFVAETVMDDIAFSLENLAIDAKTIKKKVNEVADYIGIKDLLKREPHTLSGGEKQLVALASALVIDPELLILDEALTMIDILTRNKIYDILDRLHKEKQITIINVTHDMDEVLYCDNLIVMDNGKIVLEGPKEEVLREEKAFNRLGLKLPFLVELSIKLSYYGVVDKIIFDMEEMVDIIWK